MLRFLFRMLFSINSREEVKYFRWQLRESGYQYSLRVPKNCEVLFANRAFFSRVIERGKTAVLRSFVDIHRKLLPFVYTSTPPLADTLARCYIDESPWRRLNGGWIRRGSAVAPRFSQIRLTARPRSCPGSTGTIDLSNSVGIYFATRANESDASQAIPFAFIRAERSGLWIRKIEIRIKAQRQFRETCKNNENLYERFLLSKMRRIKLYKII